MARGLPRQLGGPLAVGGFGLWASVDTSKPASDRQLKSGQLAGLRDNCFLSCLLGSGQLKSLLSAPAPWSEFDDMRVVEKTVEHGRYGR